MKPQIMHEPVLDEDEFVIMACDGIWDVITNQQAVNFVRRRLLEHQNVDRAASELVEKAIELNTIDNVSALIVALNQQV